MSQPACVTEAVLTVPGMRSNVSLEVQIPSAAHAVWLKVNAGAEELPDARYLVLHNPSNLFIYFVFFVCACAVVKRRVSSVARVTVGKSWVTGSCMLCNHGNQADTPQVFVHNKCKYFFRPQSRNVVSVIFKIKNLISTKLPQQFI